MKKFMLILIILMLVTNLVGCNINQSQKEKDDILSDEEIDEFERKNQIKILSIEMNDKKCIITYEKEKEYGIMKLYPDESPDGIGYTKREVDITKQPDKVVCVQISASKESYIALFIHDEKLRKRAKDITVEFEDKESVDKPFMISQTTNKRKSAVISYESHGELRNIKRIIIRDESYNAIWTIE